MLIFVHFSRNKSDPAKYPHSCSPRFHSLDDSCTRQGLYRGVFILKRNNVSSVLDACWKFVKLYSYMICIMTKPVTLFNLSNEALAKVRGNESHFQMLFLNWYRTPIIKGIFINSTVRWRHKWINLRNLRTRWKKSEQ